MMMRGDQCGWAESWMGINGEVYKMERWEGMAWMGKRSGRAKVEVMKDETGGK